MTEYQALDFVSCPECDDGQNQIKYLGERWLHFRCVRCGAFAIAEGNKPASDSIKRQVENIREFDV